MIQRLKPRIKKYGARWECNGLVGATPYDAYQSWLNKTEWLESLGLRNIA
jgi:hypothetical protein